MVLGQTRKTMEWHDAGECRNHDWMAQRHDLERPAARGHAHARDLREKYFPIQTTMHSIEARLERNPCLPNCDILMLHAPA